MSEDLVEVEEINFSDRQKNFYEDQQIDVDTLRITDPEIFGHKF